GLALCTTIEVAQFYDEERVTNFSDVYLNTLGTLVGGIGGTLFRGQFRWPLARELSARPVPSLLLIAMLGYHLFPYVPTIDLHKYWNSLKPVFLYPSFAPYRSFHYFSLWLTAVFLVASAAGSQLSTVYILLSVAFVFSAKILIVSLIVTVPEIIGATLALVLWFMLLNGTRATAPLVALTLCAMIIAFRLEPFTFQAMTRHFSWLPFGSFMGGSLNVNIQSFCEKFFLYGSLIWISRE